MQNAQLAFEARVTPVSSGTVTASDLAGTTVTDSAATFASDGVTPGATIVNRVNGTHATVLSIDSETQLTTEELGGGSPSGWLSGEGYDVFNVIQCNVTGGNLVALDAAGAGLDPIFPTAFTQVVRTASASATLVGLGTVEQVLRNKTVTDPLTGVMTVYDDDGVTVLFTADIFEDAAGAQPYRGQGAERRERLQ